MDEVQKRILALPIDLFFNIGELSVAPSRETLSNDARTVTAMLDRVQEVYQEILDEIKMKLNQCTVLWHARLELMNFQNGTLGPIIKAGMSKGEFYGAYDNFTLTEKRPTLNQMEYPNTQLAIFGHNSRAMSRGTKTYMFKRTRVERKIMENHLALNLGDAHHYEFTIDIQPNTAFIVNDLKVGGEKYVHYLVQQDKADPTKKAYVLSMIDKETDNAVFLSEVKDLMEKLGNPTVILMSELQKRYPNLNYKVPKPSTPREVRKDVVRLNAWGKNFYRRWDKVDVTLLDPAATKFYFLLDDYAPVGLLNFFNCSGMSSFIDDVRASGKLGFTASTPIYGLKKRSKLQLDSTWVEIGSYLATTIPTIMTDSLQNELALFLHPTGYRKEIHLEELWAMLAEDKTFPSSPAMDFASVYLPAKKTYSSTWGSALMNVVRNSQFVDSWKIAPSVPNLGLMYEDMIKNYPMLKHNQSSYLEGRVIKDMKQYIKMMDKVAQDETIAALELQNSNVVNMLQNASEAQISAVNEDQNVYSN